MKLLKRRQFGDVFSDTFEFIRENAKHFFINYLTINGIPILIFMLFYYYIMSFSYAPNFAANASGVNPIANSFMSNPEVSVLGIFFFIIVAIVMGLIQYSYTPVYFLLYKEHGASNFTAKDIFNAIFSKYLGKIILFLLASILVSIPAVIVFGIASVLLIVTIVGFIFPFIVLNQWYIMTFTEYLSSDKGVFSAFGDMLSAVFVKFWNHAGALFVFTLMIFAIYYVIAIVLAMIAGVGMSGFLVNNDPTGFVSGLSVIVMIVNQVFSIFVQALIQIANMLVYFSIKEETENISGLDEIDQIGVSE
jgi:hypothetical protein